MSHALAVVMAAAAGCWFVSDLIELKAGGHTRPNLVLTIAYHLLAVAGVWGLHLGQLDGSSGTMSLVGHPTARRLKAPCPRTVALLMVGLRAGHGSIRNSRKEAT